MSSIYRISVESVKAVAGGKLVHIDADKYDVGKAEFQYLVKLVCVLAPGLFHRRWRNLDVVGFVWM